MDKECLFRLINDDANIWECSNCFGELLLNDGSPKDNEFKFCPYCGARIVGTIEDEECE